MGVFDHQEQSFDEQVPILFLTLYEHAHKEPGFFFNQAYGQKMRGIEAQREEAQKCLII